MKSFRVRARAGEAPAPPSLRPRGFYDQWITRSRWQDSRRGSRSHRFHGCRFRKLLLKTNLSTLEYREQRINSRRVEPLARQISNNAHRLDRIERLLIGPVG